MVMLFVILLALLITTVVALELAPSIASFIRFRGKRVITCPETHLPAAVEVDARRAGLSTLFLERADLALSDCSRWPERSDCGQECLAQIEESPEDCLAKRMLTRWYEGSVCALCRSPFGEIHWHDHKPALRRADGVTLPWDRIATETLPDVLRSHLPVCWNCHIAETFRREHPDLVTDRDSRRSLPMAH